MTQASVKTFLDNVDVGELDAFFKKIQSEQLGPSSLSPSLTFDASTVSEQIGATASDPAKLAQATKEINDLISMLSDVSKTPTTPDAFCQAFVSSDFVKDVINRYGISYQATAPIILQKCVAALSAESVAALQYQDKGLFEIICPALTYEMGAVGLPKNGENLSRLLCPYAEPFFVTSFDRSHRRVQNDVVVAPFDEHGSRWSSSWWSSDSS